MTAWRTLRKARRGQRRRVMWRVVRRTLARLVFRRKLWNGNREPLSNVWSLDDANAHIRFVRITDDGQLTGLFAEGPTIGACRHGTRPPLDHRS